MILTSPDFSLSECICAQSDIHGCASAHTCAHSPLQTKTKNTYTLS